MNDKPHGKTPGQNWIQLSDRECDLMTRILKHVIDECQGRLNHVAQVDRLAVTWMRDEAKSMLPHFEPATRESDPAP